MHIPLWKKGALEKFEANLKRYSDLGFQVTLSEIDVALFSSEKEFRSMSEEEVNQRLEQQKKVYAGLMRICLRNSKCIGLSPWGLNDSDSWIRRTFGKSYEAPLLFDERLRKKPAYWGLHEALESP
jgi:endo-1,4-beta-xylanase